MKRSSLFLSILLLFIAPNRASARLDVRILEATSSVYSWEPVFVVFEVRNQGSEAVLIPLDGCGQGTDLEVGLRGGALEARCIMGHSEPRTFAWLLPGGSRLFFDSVAPGAEGIFEVEAVIRGTGHCIGSLFGPARLPLANHVQVEGQLPSFECWSGEARSQTIVANVEVPTSEVDLAAASFIGNDDRPLPTPSGLMFSMRELLARFPTSHYIYAGHYWLSAAATITAAERQPDNPLSPWAVTAYAVWLAGQTRKCATPDPTGLFKPDEAERRLDRALAVHPLPPTAKAYLDQLKLDYAAEECPEKQAEPTTSSDATTPQGSAQQTPPSTADTASSQKRQPPQPTPSAPLLSYPTPKGAGTPNMGFKQAVDLTKAQIERVHWLSLPYRYAPADVGTPGVVDAEDLCQDLGGGWLLGILRWHEPTSTFIEHTCGGPSPFPLVKGMGYGIRIAPNYHVRTDVGGGHDDDFTFSIPPTGGSQMSWISLPYHLKKLSFGPGPFTAEDLCRQIGVSEVKAIVRHDTATGIFHAYVCGSTFEQPFEIKRGTAYGVINQTGQTITWQPEHY